jgi:hypothetical protein
MGAGRAQWALLSNGVVVAVASKNAEKMQLAKARDAFFLLSAP